MRLTIDLPDQLAARVEGERDRLAEIIESGLRRQWSESSGIAREVISFLARGPRPEEIVHFRPSTAYTERARDLLDLNNRGALSAQDSAELEDMASLDHLLTLIKAEARRHAGPTT